MGHPVHAGSKHALKGCINDVLAVQDMLTTVYDFDPNDISVMIDTDDNYEQPTGGNIKVRSVLGQERPFAAFTEPAAEFLPRLLFSSTVVTFTCSGPQSSCQTKLPPSTNYLLIWNLLCDVPLIAEEAVRAGGSKSTWRCSGIPLLRPWHTGNSHTDLAPKPNLYPKPKLSARDRGRAGRRLKSLCPIRRMLHFSGDKGQAGTC